MRELGLRDAGAGLQLGFPFAPFQFVVAEIHRYPVEPSLEVRLLAERAQSLEGPDKCFLRDLFGGLRTAHHPVRSRENLLAMAHDQLVKRLAFSRKKIPYQFFIRCHRLPFSPY